MKLNTITVVTNIQSCSITVEQNHSLRLLLFAVIDHLIFKLHQELFTKLPPIIICCYFVFLFILKLDDKGAAVPNVDHDSLHARVLGKLPVK